jgi:hypothetical protein
MMVADDSIEALRREAADLRKQLALRRAQEREEHAERRRRSSSASIDVVRLVDRPPD